MSQCIGKLMYRKFIWFLSLILLLPSASFALEEIRFGVFPIAEPRTSLRIFSPIAKLIEQQTGIKVRIVTAAHKADFKKRTMKKQYQLMWTCNACYLQANKKAGYRSIVRGYPEFQGVIFVAAAGPVKKLSDLKAKKVLAVGKQSYAGYMFLRNSLLDINLRENQDYEIEFIGKTGPIPYMVRQGKADAAVFSEDNFYLSTLFKRVRKDLRVIARSEKIPQFPIAASEAISEELEMKLVSIFISIDKQTATGRQVLNPLNIKGFEKAEDSAYNDFRVIYARSKNYNKKNKK